MTRVGAADIGPSQFRELLALNLTSRSRTAKGVTDTTTTPGKKAPLLTGSALAAAVNASANRLAESAWELRNYPEAGLLDYLDDWYDIVNDGLAPSYEQERRALEELARNQLGEYMFFELNPRYRVNTPSYCHVHPLDLPGAMLEAERAILRRLRMVDAGVCSQAELLAYADIRIDGVEHPFTDGCSRVATTLVMWLSLLRPNFRLPIFGTREEHYAGLTTKGLGPHTAYYEKALAR